jgi:hypothetical protein
MTKLLFISAAASVLMAGAAAAMPVAPVTSATNLTEVRTVCNQWGECCATGSGQCFYQGGPRRVYREAPRRYYAPRAYGYYREPYAERRSYYGGPSVGVYGGYGGY